MSRMGKRERLKKRAIIHGNLSGPRPERSSGVSLCLDILETKNAYAHGPRTNYDATGKAGTTSRGRFIPKKHALQRWGKK